MKIDIASISLDVENFRHDQAKTERDALRFLLSDEKNHKVTELAQDIVAQRGLDPSSLLIVTEDASQSGQYIALEGNRRITALKTLMTPDLAAGTPGHAQFKALHQDFLDLNITAVECVVLDRVQAATWIKRKHYKGMGGAGIVAWNAVATARSDAHEGIFTRWMTALAYIESHGIDAEDIRDRIYSKTTTVERVFTSTYISSVLGLNFGKDGTLTPDNGDEVTAAKLVQSLLEAMSERAFVETKVSNADQQREFIEGFAAMSVKKPPVGPSTGATGNPAGSPEGSAGTGRGAGSNAAAGGSSAGTNGEKSAAAASGVGSGAARSKPVKTRRKLAKPGLRISNHPLNKFYSELRALDVEKNPHIASAIIRVFIEKSSTLFLETVNIPTLNKSPGATWHDYGIKFKDKVDAVLNSIDPSKKNSELGYARDIANGDRDKVHTADHLNKAIHSHLALPSHSEIITIWDRLHPYLFELFEILEKQTKP